MNEQSIIAAIDAEISRLEKARRLLGARSTTAAGIVRRTKKGGSTKSSSKPVKKRVLSAEARARIAEAQKKRWAQMRNLSAASATSKKASAKKAVKKTAAKKAESSSPVQS